MAGPRNGCGCITSRTGCLIIGWLEVILLIPALLMGLVVLTMGFAGFPYECAPSEGSVVMGDSCVDHEQNCFKPECRQVAVFSGIGLLAISTLYLFAPCCLIHGSGNGKSSFLIPYIICSILKNILSFVCFIMALMVDPITAIVATIIFGIEVYKTVVVCSHYNYLAEKPKDDNELLFHKGGYAKF